MSDAYTIITECPRDAMQGILPFIPTHDKIRYINTLLKAGFNYLDFGSFVNPKVIPQLADTEQVLDGLDLSGVSTKLLAIVGNVKGVERASKFEHVHSVGFPFSVSETFLQRNINSNFNDSFIRLQEIKEKCVQHNKQLVVYISMAFGNPYGDPWNTNIVGEWAQKLADIQIDHIALSDTVGEAQPETIRALFKHLIPAMPHIKFGAHFHTRPDNWLANVSAAYDAGCRRFDGAIKGYGGCPMAKDDLTGNLPTELLLGFLDERGAQTKINMKYFMEAMQMSNEIFPHV